MLFNEFCEKILATMTEKSPEYSFSLETLQKLNHQLKTAISCKKEGSDIGLVIYLEPLFEQFNNGTSFSTIIEKFEDAMNSDTPQFNGVNFQDFKDFNLISSRICFRVISALQNKEMLENMPHRLIEDLAIIYYIAIGNSSSDGIVQIQNSHINAWGVNETDLYLAAMNNTPKLHKAQVITMDTLIENMISSDNYGFCSPDDFDDYSSCKILVMSNPDRTYGAATIMYPDLLHTIGEKFGSDFFILPSSLHEVILVPAATDSNPNELIDMVKYVNSTEVEIEDKLTDSVYLYSISKDTLSRVPETEPLSA